MWFSTLTTAISLFLLSLSAFAAGPYGQQPVGYYGLQHAGYYGQTPMGYYPRPAPMGYSQAPQYNPAYRGAYQPHYRPVPAYPYNRPYAATPAPKAPARTQDTVAAISRPVSVSKPVIPEVQDVKKQHKSKPKKVVPNSKLVFLQKVAPLVHQVNKEVTAERAELLSLINRMNSGYDLNKEQTGWLKSRMKKYRVKGDIDVAKLREELLPKIDVIPVELALAQAANESAWGKSRFAREAQNLFGVWTYDESKGIVPKRRAKGAKHLVRKYESMQASIRHYITLLNSHPAYTPLRDIRLQHRENLQRPDGFEMAKGLIKYSAKGEKYVAIIRSMINDNNLTEFRAA